MSRIGSWVSKCGIQFDRLTQVPDKIADFMGINRISIGRMVLITARKRNLGQGNCFYTCVSFCPPGGGGWLPSMHHKSHYQVGLHPGSLQTVGVCIQGGLYPGGVCIQGGLHPRGDAWDTMEYRRQQTYLVRILLECFLVFSFYFNMNINVLANS